MQVRWLAITLLLLGCQSQPTDLLPAVMQRAHEAYARGDYELAARLCDYVLQQDSSHMPALTLRQQAEQDRRVELDRLGRDLDPHAVPQTPGNIPNN